MISGQFGALIQELGRELNMNLKPDSNDSCLIRFPNGMKIQMEIEDKDEFFVLIADLGSVPIGRYREDIFREALQFNNSPQPRLGTFAYSDSADVLLFFRMMHLKGLNGQKIAEVLVPLTNKAHQWKEAILKGEHPPTEFHTSQGNQGLSGLMGLKP